MVSRQKLLVVPIQLTLVAVGCARKGKTLQALIGVAISHVDCVGGAKDDNPKSLVVCPSSVVGHWEKEIRKFFPGDSLFRPLALTGSGGERKAMFELHFAMCNIVVTSFSALRSDVDILSKPLWRFCILDEGHLLKNPKTGKCSCISAEHLHK